MSSARSRKYRNECNDRLDRAKAAKNPRIENSIYGEYPQQQPERLGVGGTIGSWKEFHKDLGMLIMAYNVGLENGESAAQVRNGEVVQEQGIRPDEQRRLIPNGVEFLYAGVNNFNLGNEVWNYPAPQRGRNEAPQWEVHFAPDPTVRFENMDAPVAPKEPDICDIITLDD